MMLLQGQDCGFDVDSVENLIRRHEETEREAGVIQERAKVGRFSRRELKNVVIVLDMMSWIYCPRGLLPPRGDPGDSIYRTSYPGLLALILSGSGEGGVGSPEDSVGDERQA